MIRNVRAVESKQEGERCEDKDRQHENVKKEWKKGGPSWTLEQVLMG